MVISAVFSNITGCCPRTGTQAISSTSPALYLLIGTFVAAFGAVVTAYKSWRDLKNAEISLIESQYSKEREDIRYRLNNFYGPFKEIRTESRFLYRIFALEEKRVEREKKGYFRTLTHLCQGKPLLLSDKEILNNILSLGKKQLELIEKEGWAVSNTNLAEILGQLGAHIRLLLLASEYKLNGMEEKLKDFVFPLEIDGAIDTEIRKLQDRYLLLMNPKKTIRKNEQKYPINAVSSTSFYDKNALDYYMATAYADLSDIYSEFRRQISDGATILDAGCGVGRDTRYFTRHGYKVVAFDASAEMVKLCRRYPFAYCLHKTFQEIEYIEEFDAVWACASFVHLSHTEMTDGLTKMVNALKPGGIIYISLKGTEVDTADGRIFFYHEPSELLRIADNLFNLALIKWWSNLSKKHQCNDSWTNYIFRKPKLN